MSASGIDQSAFERQLGTQVSQAVFASISASGASLYLALNEIVQEISASQDESLASRIKAIASTAFIQATN
jgi:hypothetical protein